MICPSSLAGAEGELHESSKRKRRVGQGFEGVPSPGRASGWAGGCRERECVRGVVCRSESEVEAIGSAGIWSDRRDMHELESQDESAALDKGRLVRLRGCVKGVRLQGGVGIDGLYHRRCEGCVCPGSGFPVVRRAAGDGRNGSVVRGRVSHQEKQGGRRTNGGTLA